MGTKAAIFPYILAIGANLSFGTASIIFSKYAKRFNPIWVNRLKASVALTAFLILFLMFESPVSLGMAPLLFLMASGFLGLCVGDFFLFRAFTELGPTRTLVLYSFQPLFLGIYGYFFIGQTLSSNQFFAILCMIACVITFILERNKSTGKWGMGSFSFAFLGILFDAFGVMLTRSAYENTPALGPAEANTIRALGAVLGFVVLSPLAFRTQLNDLKRLERKDSIEILSSCVLGTVISLTLYLTALKTAHVATLTAIAITGPVWVSILEHFKSKTLPNRHLVIAFGFFFVGFALLTIH